MLVKLFNYLEMEEFKNEQSETEVLWNKIPVDVKLAILVTLVT